MHFHQAKPNEKETSSMLFLDAPSNALTQSVLTTDKANPVVLKFSSSPGYEDSSEGYLLHCSNRENFGGTAKYNQK